MSRLRLVGAAATWLNRGEPVPRRRPPRLSADPAGVRARLSGCTPNCLLERRTHPAVRSAGRLTAVQLTCPARPKPDHQTCSGLRTPTSFTSRRRFYLSSNLVVDPDWTALDRGCRCSKSCARPNWAFVGPMTARGGMSSNDHLTTETDATQGPRTASTRSSSMPCAPSSRTSPNKPPATLTPSTEVLAAPRRRPAIGCRAQRHMGRRRALPLKLTSPVQCSRSRPLPRERPTTRPRGRDDHRSGR